MARKFISKYTAPEIENILDKAAKPNIIDVAELPTENINEQAIYRIITTTSSEPTPVRNEGFIKDLYINTKMSTNEVFDIISQVTPNADGFYYFLKTADKNFLCILDAERHVLGIGDQVAQEILFATPEGSAVLQIGWSGWSPTLLSNKISINNTAESSFIDNTETGPETIQVGLQNDLIKTVFSETPFIQSETVIQYFIYSNSTWQEINIDGPLTSIENLPVTQIKKNKIYKTKSPIFGLWKSTPLVMDDNSVIQDIYFNKQIGAEEVIKLIDKMPLTEVEPGIQGAVLLTTPLDETDTPPILNLIVLKTNDMYMIQGMGSAIPENLEDIVFMYSSEGKGWNPLLPEKITINSVLASSFPQDPAGPAINIIQSKETQQLLGSSSFNKEIISYDNHYNVYGDDDQWHLLNEGIIDVKELPNKDINSNVFYRLQKEEILDPVAVPKQGAHTIYFNYNLSIEEVKAELDKLTYVDDEGMGKETTYFMAGSSTDAFVMIAFRDAPLYYIMYMDATIIEPQYIFFSSNDSPDAPFQGWNPLWAKPNKSVTAQSLIEIYGDENDLIANLFSITPFTPQENNSIWYYNNKWIETCREADIIPINKLFHEGFIGSSITKKDSSTLFFNIKMPSLRIKSILDSIPDHKWERIDNQNYILLMAKQNPNDGSVFILTLEKREYSQPQDYILSNHFSYDSNGYTVPEKEFLNHNFDWNYEVSQNDGRWSVPGYLIDTVQINSQTYTINPDMADMVSSIVSADPLIYVEAPQEDKIYRLHQHFEAGYTNTPYPSTGLAVPMFFNTQLTPEEIHHKLDTLDLKWYSELISNKDILLSYSDASILTISTIVSETDPNSYSYIITSYPGLEVYFSSRRVEGQTSTYNVGWKEGFNGQIDRIGSLSEPPAGYALQNDKMTWLVGSTPDFKYVSEHDKYKYYKYVNDWEEFITDQYSFPDPVIPIEVLNFSVTAPQNYWTNPIAFTIPNDTLWGIFDTCYSKGQETDINLIINFPVDDPERPTPDKDTIEYAILSLNHYSHRYKNDMNTSSTEIAQYHFMGDFKGKMCEAIVQWSGEFGIGDLDGRVDFLFHTKEGITAAEVDNKINTAINGVLEEKL